MSKRDGRREDTEHWLQQESKNRTDITAKGKKTGNKSNIADKYPSFKCVHDKFPS